MFREILICFDVTYIFKLLLYYVLLPQRGHSRVFIPHLTLCCNHSKVPRYKINKTFMFKDKFGCNEIQLGIARLIA